MRKVVRHRSQRLRRGCCSLREIARRAAAAVSDVCVMYVYVSPKSES